MKSKIGIELELQILDSESLDLTDKIEPLISMLGTDSQIDREVIQCCVEIKTEPVMTIKSAREQIIQKLQKVFSCTEYLKIELCSLPVHPFSQKVPEVTNRKRYLELEKEFPFITHQQITFATHLHVSMESLEESIRVMKKLRILLPSLVALSASCPYWKGERTEFVSFRQYLLQSSFNGGTPPFFEDTDEFHCFLNAAKISGVIKTLKDIHWDIRPRPDLGTLELRIMDAVPTIQDTMAIVGFAWCLVETLKTKELVELIPEIEHVPWAIPINNFQVSHHGIEAPFILNRKGKTIKVKTLVLELLRQFQEEKEDDLKEEIQNLKGMITQSSLPYQRVTNIYEETKSLKELVKKLSLALRLEAVSA